MLQRKKQLEYLAKLRGVLSFENAPLLLQALDIFSPVVKVIGENPQAILENNVSGQGARNKISESVKKSVKNEKDSIN